MTAVVVAMILVAVVTFVVLSVFSGDDEDWSSKPGQREPGEGGIDDLLDP